MKTHTLPIMRVLLATMALGLASAAPFGKAGVLIVGDEWADAGAGAALLPGSLEAMFKRHKSNCTVIPEEPTLLAPGMEAWRLNMPVAQLQIATAIKVQKPKYIWVSVGLNDLINGAIGCPLVNETIAECIEKITTKYESDMQQFYDFVNKTDPKVKVVSFGYDILNFGSGRNLMCEEVMSAFKECTKKGKTIARCLNEHFLKIQNIDTAQAATNGNFDAVSLLGAMQHAGGVKNATVGHPNLDDYSPYDLMVFHSCTVPNPKGMEAVTEAFWSTYWSKADCTNKKD